MIQERARGVCSLAGCGKLGAARCSRCKAWYCSLQCQEDDWPTHLRLCFEIPPLEWLDPENDRNPSITSTNSGNTVLVGSVEATEVKESGTGDVKNKEQKDAGIAVNSNPVSREENNNSTVMATEKEVHNTKAITNESRESKAEVEKGKELSTQKVKEETKQNKLDVVEAVEKTKPVAQDVEENGQETKLNKLDVGEAVVPEKTKPVAQDVEAVEKIKPAAKDGKESDTMVQGSKSSEVKQQESFKYKEALISPKVQAQLPEEIPEGWSEMVVSHLVSPSEFYIHLLADSELYTQMQELVNKVRTPADTDWKIGRKEPVRAFVEDSWHRGFAAKKKGQEFEVFLFDLGEMVTVKQENLKRLPDELTQVPPLAYQVCLSGVGPVAGGEYSRLEIDTFFTLITDETYPMTLRFLGQLEGGRWLVKLQGKEDQADLTQFILDNDFLAAREDAPVIPRTEVLSANTVTTAKKEESTNPVTEKVPSPPVKVVRGPVLPKRDMSEEGCEATVKSIVSPATFYVFPTLSKELFSAITLRTQSSRLEGEVEPVPGTVCLVKDPEDGLCYRAEILGIEEDGKVSLFLIDNGKELVEEVKQLRPLPEDLSEEPGILIKVSLRGIADTPNTDLEDLKLVLDVGGETKFLLTEPKFVDGKWYVNAKDSDGEDVAKLLIQCEIPSEELIAGSELTPTVLPVGVQELVVIKAVSPTEIYVTTNAMLNDFLAETTVSLNQIGESSDYVNILKAGDLILAYQEDSWNRATVNDPDALQIKFVDFPEVVQKEQALLRKAPREVLQFPVLVAKCCLDSFYGKEEEWSQVEKMRSLLQDYTPHEGEVVGSQDGVTRIKIPDVESQLVPPAAPARLSKREALLKKFKK